MRNYSSHLNNPCQTVVLQNAAADCDEMNILADDDAPDALDAVDAAEDNCHSGREIVKMAHSDDSVDIQIHPPHDKEREDGDGIHVCDGHPAP